MSFLLRLCLGLFLLAPALAHARSSLDIPSEGDKLSGIGLISGWKCEAEGDITIEFFTDGVSRGDPLPTTYGSPRADTSPACGDDDGNNGFYALYNWAILSDGEHTAVASDNGVEFARNTFTVTTTGEEFLTDAPDTCVTVDDFPSTGETTYLEWNESTQHFEMVESCAPMPSEPSDLGMCEVGWIVKPGQMCSGSALGINFTFSVNAEGQACIDDTVILDGCHDTSEAFNTAVSVVNAAATKNADNSWTIDRLP